MPEVTLDFLFDAVVIYVLLDLKVKRNLMSQTNKRHLVRRKFFFHARNDALLSLTKQVTFHAYDIASR